MKIKKVKSKIKLCRYCLTHPASIPDRNRTPGRLILSVCSICHTKRLNQDLARLIIGIEKLHKANDKIQKEIKEIEDERRK